MTIKISAFVPLRFATDCSPDGGPRFSLGGVPLWCHTLDLLTSASEVDDVVVACDDPRIEAQMEPWHDRIRIWRRPATLSAANVTTVDVLAAYARENQEAAQPDYYLLAEITHALRPRTLIEQIVSIANRQPADTILTARAVRYPIWRPTPDGMQRLDITPDQEAVFEEMSGICSLFSPRWLLTDNHFGIKVDVVPTDRFWAVLDIRSEEVAAVAEQYLASKRSGQ